MKKLYNLFSKYNTILILVILIFSIDLLTQTAVQSIKFKNELSSISNAKAIKFGFQDDEKMSTDEIISTIENKREVLTFESDNIIFHIPGDIARGKAIYTKIEKNDIPLINGRFLNIDDFKNNANCVVIGKDLEQFIKVKDNRKYITIADENLEVVGVMGSTKNTTAYDNTFYINLSGFKLPNEKLESIYNYKLIGTCSENELKNIVDDLCRKYDVNSLQYMSIKEPITFNEIYDNVARYIPIIFIVLIFIGANLSNIFRFWWESNKLKFTINRMVGATKIKIVKMAIYIMFKQFSIALLFTYGLNFIVYAFMEKVFSNYIFANSITSIIITVSILFALCLSILFIPIYKLVNKEINNNIRGI